MIEPSNFRSRLGNAAVAIRLFKNFPEFFFNYFGIIRRPTSIYGLRNGVKYRIRNRTSDFRVIREIWVAGDYQPAGFQIEPDDLVLDIGAQIGIFTLRAARQAVRGRVHAFEPFPDNYSILEENVALNQAPNIRLYRQAVAASAGSREFHVSGYNTGGHSLYTRAGSTRTIRVETTTLENHFREHQIQKVDFLKLDCEGAEAEILQACPAEVWSRVRRIAMETHPELGSSPADLKSLLESRGFQVTVDHDMVFARRT